MSAAIAAGALAVAACYPAVVRPTAPPATPLEAAAAGRFMDSVAAAQHLPGFAATVMRGRTVIWRHGYGFADAEAKIPATTTTRFRIGSVSKLLTATLLVRLAQERQLSLDEPVGRYVTVPTQLSTVSFRQLAGHLGGVRHYRGNEFLTNEHFATLADALGVFVNDSLVAQPGTRYSYSSYGYNLIGAALERARSTPFPVLMRRYVTEPLALDATVPDAKGVAIPDRAVLYDVAGGKVSRAPDDDLSGRWPSGGYLSTTDDLARFAQTTLAPGLLDAASLALMLSPQHVASGAATNVGIGWRIGTDSVAGTFYHHGGSSNGGSAFILVYPRQQLVVAMAANALGQWSDREARAVARFFLP